MDIFPTLRIPCLSTIFFFSAFCLQDSSFLRNIFIMDIEWNEKPKSFFSSDYWNWIP